VDNYVDKMVIKRNVLILYINKNFEI